MKKRLVLLLVTAMAATTVLAGCGSKDSGSSDSGKKSAKESKVENDDDTLIVGFDEDFNLGVLTMKTPEGTFEVDFDA